MLKSILLAFTLLITPAAAQQCMDPAKARSQLEQLASVHTQKVVEGDLAKRVNEAVEATVNARNPFEFDSVTVYTLTYQGSRLMFFVYFKDNCAVSQMVMTEAVVARFAENLANRGINF